MTIDHFFHQPVKNKQEAYKKLIEMSRNDDYATGNLLHFSYHQNYYKLTDIDLSTQTNTCLKKIMVQQYFYCWKAA